jgi:hypothetical protein
MRIVTNRPLAVGFIIAAMILGSCGGTSHKAADVSNRADCRIDLSFEGRLYHMWKPRHEVTNGKVLGTARYSYCGRLAEPAKVAKVPGFAPKAIIRVVDSWHRRYVFISAQELKANATAADLPPRLRKLLLGTAR